MSKLNSALLDYLVERAVVPGDRLPALAELAGEMQVSVGKLREQLELARHLNLVSVRPRLGMRREPFDFLATMRTGFLFSLATGEATFSQISQLRRSIEESLWDEAVHQLTAVETNRLQELVTQAWAKLQGDPVYIPNGEHRELHLTIYSRLDNPFVQGLLAAYWEAYEASELTRYADFQYWLNVWTFHSQIVEAICAGEFDRGRQLLKEHFNLLPAALPLNVNGRELLEVGLETDSQT
jgi:DNA-binding FadR family transcriptional regulator